MTTTMDRESLLGAIERDLAANNVDGALSSLWRLSEQTRTIDAVFRRQLLLFSRCFQAKGLTRAAASIEIFNQSDQAWRAVRAGADPRDAARLHALNQQHTEAAAEYLTAGYLGHAALQLEEAKNDRGALEMWQRLLSDSSLNSDKYVRALVTFNLSRNAGRLGDRMGARRALVESVHLLEAAADEFETLGVRERAFDCYQVLLTLGRDGAFENLAEGYLNSIRILKQDHLKYYVLQYYEDFQGIAFERKEFHAAATLCREAAEFCIQNRMPQADYYKDRAAEAYSKAAATLQADGAPAELIENSFAAAIDVLNDLGAKGAIRQTFEAMATLDLPEKRRTRYARLAARYATETAERPKVAGFPAHLKMQTAYPDVWRLDVVEWEQRGDAAETMADIAFSKEWPEFTRARALLCRLFAQSVSDSDSRAPTQAQLAHLIGRTEVYAALKPLELLYLQDNVVVRRAAIKAIRQLYFKRSFATVALALRDADREVRDEAVLAIEQLHFTHAFDALARIHREATDSTVRDAALRSIGKIQSLEAIDYLVTTYLQNTAPVADLARELLVRAEHSETRNELVRAMEDEIGDKKAGLAGILSARGDR